MCKILGFFEKCFFPQKNRLLHSRVSIPIFLRYSKYAEVWPSWSGFLGILFYLFFNKPVLRPEKVLKTPALTLTLKNSSSFVLMLVNSLLPNIDNHVWRVLLLITTTTAVQIFFLEIQFQGISPNWINLSNHKINLNCQTGGVWINWNL